MNSKINNIDYDYELSILKSILKTNAPDYIDKLFSTLKIDVDNRYINYIFFITDLNILAHYYKPSKIFFIDDNTWNFVKTEFNYNYIEYIELIKYKVKEYFDLEVNTVRTTEIER